MKSVDKIVAFSGSALESTAIEHNLEFDAAAGDPEKTMRANIKKRYRFGAIVLIVCPQ